VNHLKENNETYINHLLFAGKIGLSLLLRGAVFIFHGIFPMIRLPRNLNITGTIAKLQEWHSYTIRRLDK